MKIRRSVAALATPRRVRLIAAASGIVAASAFVVPSATAAPHANLTPEKATALASHLGTSNTAGAYYDAASKKSVVNVTNGTAAAAVADAGGVARTVSHSTAYLNKAGKAVEKDADIAGTAWVINPRTDTLDVTADSRVTKAQLAKLEKVVSSYGDAVTIKRTSGRFSKLISGGDQIETTQWICSLGFNVTDGSNDYFLTAGHCTQGLPDWYTGSGSYFAYTVDSQFPGNDFGIAAYDSSSTTPQGTVGSVDITGAANPTVGESVTRRGRTTGTHSGTVTGLNATVNYGSDGIVYGMIDTNVCAEPGDSGGPLYSGHTALGLTSGGSGDCTSGGETFFQPVTEALSAYGVTLL